MATITAARSADGAIALGPLRIDTSGDTIRLTFAGVEVVRQIDCPIRDADWRTFAITDTAAARASTEAEATLERRFRTEDDAFEGRLSLTARAGERDATVTLSLVLSVQRSTSVNRAGFVLLHPAALAGAPLTVRHSDGSTTDTAFPDLISPGQPVFDIAGLRHRLHGITVDIGMEGETFEMEDQRNWTDASFKTYCRPLSRPRPYTLAAGETVTQSLTIALSGAPTIPASTSSATTVPLPALSLAHEAALVDRPAPGGLASLAPAGLLLRVDARAPDLSRPLDAPLTLEIVADAAEDIATVAALCARAGIAPARVIALPRPYLASHQPEGPWPSPTPADFILPARAAFPDAEIGGGVLTNFTEFNRCPPDPAVIDFATFGTTAIVHAADDRSVRETLEALPAVFASASALAGDRPLHLGLVSIAMRSNPYGSATAPNPGLRRIAMATDDPRQRTAFAAAFALGAIAEAARAGIASLAPAMAAGPLAPGPALLELLAALTPLAGASVRIAGGPGRLLTLTAGSRMLAANLGAEPISFDGRTLASMEVDL
jgi:hypothetical protein